MMQLPPLSLYIHLPWCVKKCPYCDFNSHEGRQPVPFGEYIDALITDLEQDLPLVWGRPLVSIFIGGGTPSLFSATDIGRLLQAVSSRLIVRPDAEITLEANPGAIEHDEFEAYHAAGVNRVSLGVQSFDDGCLGRIGRIHGSREVHQALDSLTRSGLERYNLDLMYGLPGQTVQQAREDIEQALSWQPRHVSHYQLTLEPNTAFGHAPPDLPDEPSIDVMQSDCSELLRSAGMSQYEVSAWAVQGSECQHNNNYWRFGDYLGIGAGAHGKLTDLHQQRVVRTAKHRHPKRYLESIASGRFTQSRRELGPDDLVFEFFLNQLRLRRPLQKAEFEARTGLPWSATAEPVQSACERGFLVDQPDSIETTPQGWDFLNDLQAIFLPEKGLETP